MTIIELLAIIVPTFALLINFVNMRRAHKESEDKSSREMAVILTEIGYIKSQMETVTRKFDTHEDRYIALTERVSGVEQSSSSAHHRIDMLMGKAAGQ